MITFKLVWKGKKKRRVNLYIKKKKKRKTAKSLSRWPPSYIHPHKNSDYASVPSRLAKVYFPFYPYSGNNFYF